MPIKESELILNPDGSAYHLNLKPEDIATTIITVGDPERVEDVTRHFDSIELSTHKREFKTQTGRYRGKRITVISTGIGTDNIDIVFNELDALVNIDFKTRRVKESLKSLDFIRIGTSGAIQPDIPVDSFLVSRKAIGFDSLLHFYGDTAFLDASFSEALINHTNWNEDKSKPYIVSGSAALIEQFDSDKLIHGITATNVGFYGPQGRKLRLELQDEGLNKKLESFRFNEQRITNLEMETSGIYGMSKLLGHRSISMNAILANRATGSFSSKPQETVNNLIKYCLDALVI